MRVFKRFMIVIACALLSCYSAYAWEWSGNITGETRLFMQSPLDSRQADGVLSLSFQGDIYHDWAEGEQRFVCSPFFRLDQHDRERTHLDFRELYWEKMAENWELRLGLKQVFWGVTESVHLVNVINQADVLEEIDGSAKLGQPMANLSWIQDWGVLDFYVMPYFREASFPGVKGRLRPPLPVVEEDAAFESRAEEWNTDLALRWSHSMGNWDVALSHFSGTSRSARYLPDLWGVDLSFLQGFDLTHWLRYIKPLNRLGLELIPYYDQIEQSGAELLWTHGDWVWKLEAIHTSGRRPRTYTAVVTGVEYTFYSVFETNIDTTLVAEYLYDSRGRKVQLAPFENDVFMGIRFSFNDVQSTSIQLGSIMDLDTGALFFGLEGSRRLGEDWKLSAECRLFNGFSDNEILWMLHRDDMVKVELSWYF